MKLSKEKSLFIFFILIFLIFSFFRFYNLEKRIIFDWDQERDAFVVKDLLINHKPTLIGPRVIGDLGFFLGPYYYYLLAPFYFLTKLDPKAIIYFVYFFNSLFFISAFFILKKIFNSFFSLLFLFFWTINLFLIKIDIIPWNVLLIPLGILLNWLFLFQLAKKINSKKFLFLGFLNGFFLNFHFQFIFINIFTLIYLFLFFLKKKFKIKLWFYFIFGFLITFIPLLIFDLRHNFLNSKLIINWFFNKKEALVIDRNIWLQILGYALESFIFTNKTIFIKIFYFIFTLILIYLIKIKKGFNQRLYQSTLSLWLVFPLAFIIYGQRPSEYYFLFLFPYIFVVMIDFFVSINKKIILFIFTIFLVFLNKDSLINSIHNNSLSLFYKAKTIKVIKKVIDNKKTKILINTPLGLDYGFKYLLDFYKINQVQLNQDFLVKINIPFKKNDFKINDTIGYSFKKY